MTVKISFSTAGRSPQDPGTFGSVQDRNLWGPSSEEVGMGALALDVGLDEQEKMKVWAIC